MYVDTEPSWDAPHVSTTGTVTTLEMTQGDKRKAAGKRRPLGFVPPQEEE